MAALTSGFAEADKSMTFNRVTYCANGRWAKKRARIDETLFRLEHSKNMLMNANRLAIVGASKNSTMNNATAKSARRGGIS